MRTKKINMLQGNLYRSILLFALPLVASNLLQVLFSLADVAVVGRFAGAMALGSVGSVTMIVTLFTTFLIGVANAVNVFCARYLGSHREDKVRKTVFNAFLVMLGCGILVMIFSQIWGRNLLVLLHTKEELIDGAELYFKLYFLGMPALGIYNWGNAIFAGDGDTVKPLCFLSISGICNILLNLFFVIGLKMSVAGVALASCISQWLSAILITIALYRTEKPYRFRFDLKQFDGKNIAQILKLGLPSGLQNMIFYIANLFIQSAVNSFDAITVAGIAAAANADSLVYDVMTAFYAACASFIAQNYGAGKFQNINRIYRITTLYSFGAAAILGVSLFFLGRPFLSIFTTDPQVMDAGMYRLHIMGLSYAFSAFMDNTIAASRGLGKTVWPMVFVFLGSCAFRIVWIMTIFAHFHTLNSLFSLYIFSWAFTAVLEIIYYKKTLHHLPQWN